MVLSGEYDLAVTFSRKGEHHGVCVILPVGSHMCLLALNAYNGTTSGLMMIDGKEVPDNPTTIHRGRLMDGKKYDLQIRTRLQGQFVSIEVALDKVPIIHWSGKQSSLDLPQRWKLPQDRSGQLALGSREQITFHSAKLKMISGNASWLDEDKR